MAVKDSTGSVALANEKSIEFLTGYLIEKSLAVDNIFVFLLIFSYFFVPEQFRKRVLMIGIIGAIVLHSIMILLGSWLLAEFHWILYVFGAFLLAAVANKFHLLNYGLAVVLVFIGAKMCLVDVFHIPVAVSLGVVVSILIVTMLLSMRSATPSVR